MALLLSLIGYGCLIGAAASWLRYDGAYFSLLVTNGVILAVGAEIVSAIGQLRRPSPQIDSFQIAELERLLKSIEDRLIGLKSATDRVADNVDPERRKLDWRSRG